MQVGIIGLGRMGGGVAERLLKGGHDVTVYNRTIEKAEPFKEQGAKVAATIEDLVASLSAPRVVWLYLPSGDVTKSHLDQLLQYLEPGDILLDGGNSRFTETLKTAAIVQEKGVHFLDVGTSGGVGGRTKGYCLMVGGEQEIFTSLDPLWQSVAQEKGYELVGAAGAGHYVKMVHNAIEYGMMQAYGEGMELLSAGHFAGQLDLKRTTDVWQHGSIIESYLGELVREMIHEDPDLSSIGPKVEDNGEGRWAIEEGLLHDVPTPVITASLFARFESRRTQSFGHKVIAMMRNKFGGHAVDAK